MVELHREVAKIVGEDPAVAGVGSSVGGTSFSGQANSGNMFVTLKPLSERNGMSAQRVIDRLRTKVAKLPGVQMWMFPAQDLRVGGRQGNAQYQFTLWSDNFDELLKWLPQVEERVKKIDGVTDVSTDRNQGGLQLEVTVDRPRASNLGVKMQAIDSALGNAFAQRQISTIYSPRNQYRVILEIDPQFQRDPGDVSQVYVPGTGNTPVPLAAVAKFQRGLAPLTVNHQGQYPAITISFGLKPDVTLSEGTDENPAGGRRDADA